MRNITILDYLKQKAILYYNRDQKLIIIRTNRSIKVARGELYINQLYQGPCKERIHVKEEYYDPPIVWSDMTCDGLPAPGVECIKKKGGYITREKDYCIEQIKLIIYKSIRLEDILQRF